MPRFSHIMRLFGFRLPLLLLLALPSFAFAGPTPLRVVMDDNYPPYIFRDGNGTLQGILVDEWHLWQEKTGIPVTLDAMDWGEAKRRMEAGKYDVIDTIFRTTSRLQSYDFSPAYARLEVPAFFRSDISGIAGITTLRGFPVAVKSGDAAIEMLHKAGVETLIEYPNYEAIVQAAAAGKVNVFVADRPPALYFLHKYGLANAFRASTPYTIGEFHRAVRKGNTATLALVNDGFSRISAAEHQAIATHWHGTELPGDLLLPRQLLIGGGIVLAATLLLLAWTMTLRRSVGRKTRALAASEEKYRLLVENQSDLVVKVDALGHFLYVSPSYCRTFGRREDELLGQQYMPLVHEDDRLATAQAVATLCQPPHRCYLEQRALTASGWRWLSWNDTAILDAAGEIIEIIGVGNDITSRKEAEENLQRSSQQFATLFANMSEGVALHELVLDTAGTPINYRLINVNQSYETIVGLQREDIAGKLATEVYGSATPPYLSEFSQPALTGRPGRLETYFPPLDKYFDISIVPWGENGFATIFSDISVRKRSEETLHQSEVTFRKLFEDSSDAILLIDGTGVFVECNQAALDLLKMSRDQFLLLPPSRISPEFQPDGRRSAESAPEMIAQAYSKGLHRFDWTCLNAEGSEFIVEVSLMPITIKGQTMLHTTWRDITKRKEAELELRQAHNAAEAASRAKSEFLSTMSHEIRTPLNGVTGMAELLQMTPLNETQKEYLHILQTSADNLLALINDILDLARIEAGKMTMEDLDFEPQACIDEVVATQRLALQKKGLQLTVSVAEDCPLRVKGDALRFKQIFFNLLGNAVKFTDHGTIEIRVRIEARRNGEVTLRFSIADSGIGMNEELQRRLFAPFEQGDASANRKYGGSGLGLSICQRLVQMMRGHIEVDSHLGSGSTFHVILPFVVATAAAAAEGAPPGEPPASRPLRVLVVEDNAVNRTLLILMLQELGHQAVGAAHGQAALECWQREPFDLVLMDIQMPVMDGVEALQHIRRQELEHLSHRQVVVALTAHAMDGDREKLLADGFDGYLAKPFRLQQLSEVLHLAG